MMISALITILFLVHAVYTFHKVRLQGNPYDQVPPGFGRTCYRAQARDMDIVKSTRYWKPAEMVRHYMECHLEEALEEGDDGWFSFIDCDSVAGVDKELQEES